MPLNVTQTRRLGAKLRRGGALAVEATIALAVADLAVRILPSRRVAALLGTTSRQPPSRRPAARTAEAMRIGLMVDRAAARLPWHPVCLPQAIATRWLLRRRGIRCVSHLGVVERHPFSAHAWITVDGAIVQGAGVVTATELAALR
jgi:hypothetical protein